MVATSSAGLGITHNAAHCLALGTTKSGVIPLDHNRSVVVCDDEGMFTQGSGISVRVQF